MRNEYSYRERDADLNNYIVMYNNNVAQINNLYAINWSLQNNINLIRNTAYRPRARRYHRNTGPPPLVVPSDYSISPSTSTAPSTAPFTAPFTAASTPTHIIPPTPSTTPSTSPALSLAPGLVTSRSRPRTNAFGLPSSAPATPISSRDSTSNENTNPNTNATTRTRVRRQTFFDPVIIYPTQRQIENATRFVQYDTIETPSNDSCPFTCEPFNNEDMVRQILYCGHICSSAGFNTWFNSNVSCPICRYDIRNYRPTAIFDNEDLVSDTASLPAPQSTSAPQTRSAPQSRPLSSLSQLINIDNVDDESTELLIRNYLGLWYDAGQQLADAATMSETTSGTTGTTGTTTPSNNNGRNVLYYTIRNLDR